MKKKIGLMLTLLCILVLCLFVFTSCGVKLSAPTGFKLNGDTLELSWNKVREATGYYIEIDDDVKTTTKKNTYPLANLDAGEHIVRVQAITNNEEIENSDFAEYIFEKDEETGLVYKLINNNSEYELVGIGFAEGDVVMEDEFRKKPVTSIAKGAFRRSSRLTSFTVGKYVKTIGEYAFAACSELESITIPDSVQSISAYAFQNCPKLETVVIPGSIGKIDEYTFSLCKGLKSVTIGEGITEISKYAFTDCVELSELIFPSTVTSFGEYAFSGCKKIGELTVGKNVISIGDYAFCKCESLETITFETENGSAIESIGMGAFSETKIGAVSIPDTVKTLGYGAFENCTSLENVTLGSAIESIGPYAFNNTKFYNDAEGLVVVGGWVIESKNKKIEEFVADESIVGIADAAFFECKKLQTVSAPSVKHVGEYAFSDCDLLWEVVLGDALLTIGDYGFAICPVLRYVKIGNSLRSIGEYAFSYCSTLEDSGINLPNTLEKVGTRAFIHTRLYKNSETTIVYVDNWVVGMKSNNYAVDVAIKDGVRGLADYAFYDGLLVNSVYLPDSVEIVGRGAFYGATYVSYLNIPKSVKYIGDYAFANCSYTIYSDNAEIIIPEGCEYIGDYAFWNNLYVATLSIPGSVKSIGKYAFRGCTNIGAGQLGTLDEEGNFIPIIGSITLGDGIEHIGEGAFYECSGLVDVVIPDSVTAINKAVFYKCKSIKNLTIGSGITYIADYAFYNCEAIEQIIIPTRVKSIGSYAFRGASAAKQLVLNEGLESVGTFAFYKCSGVKNLVLPSTLKEIGDYSFRNMSSLKAIMIGDGLETIGKHVFYGNEATIYTEFEELPSHWAERWNSSYRPVIWGVTLSDDSSFVVSFVKNSEKIENASEKKTITNPTRPGYTFAGYATEEDGEVVYGSEDFVNAPDGTTLYTRWTEGEPVEEEPEIPENQGGESNGDSGADNGSAAA